MKKVLMSTMFLVLCSLVAFSQTGSSITFVSTASSTCDVPATGKTILCGTPNSVTVSFNGNTPVVLPAAGTPGAAATVTIGTTTTGAVGSNATVTNSGTSNAAVLNFTIPRGATGATGAAGTNGTNGTNGADGQAATITVGTVTTLPAGSNATVTNSGTSSAAVLNFGVPQGAVGSSTSFTSFSCTSFTVSNGVLSGSGCTFH